MRHRKVIFTIRKRNESYEVFGWLSSRSKNSATDTISVYVIQKKEKERDEGQFLRCLVEGDNCRLQIHLSQTDFNPHEPDAAYKSIVPCRCLGHIELARSTGTITASAASISLKRNSKPLKLEQDMASIKWMIILIAILGISYDALGAIEDSERNLLGLNFPYGRGLDSELQLARLLLLPPRLYHPKRNSELINSLLGLPKNMNNAGK